VRMPRRAVTRRKEDADAGTLAGTEALRVEFILVMDRVLSKLISTGVLFRRLHSIYMIKIISIFRLWKFKTILENRNRK
jgi:hypothetical protein